MSPNTMLARWREGFARDPAKAVADLISGRAALGSAGRVGVPEFLAQEFGGPDGAPGEVDPDGRAQRRQQLDAALLGWLQQMVGDEAPAQVRRLGAAVYARRLCDALVAMQWLELPVSLGDLRARREWWHERLLPWRMSSARDPALELRRALTRVQPDASLLSLWLRLADDPRDEYVAVALAGLQGLPEAGHGADIHQHCLHALLRHAARQPDAGQARSTFHREYAALRARYPRPPAHWQTALRRVLETVANNLPGQVGRQLRDDLMSAAQGGKPTALGAGSRRAPSVTKAPVPKALGDTLKTDIQSRRGSGDELATRLIRIAEQDLAYARHSGDSYFFTRTLHNLGSRLMGTFSLSAPSLDRLGQLIEESLLWEPGTSYLWMLLADWFDARHWHEQREWTLRETARLFPRNEHSRVELARLLIRRGQDHWGEAERWLREAVGFSARHEHSRVELARLLIRRGQDHWGEAERWLREAAGFSARNEHSRVELARLLIRRGPDHWGEAERWLHEVAGFSARSEPARVELARLLIRRGPDHWGEAERWLREVAGFSARNEHSRVELARLLIRRGPDHWGEAERWLREVAGFSARNEPSRLVLAVLLYRRGPAHHAEAWQLLQHILRHNPANASAQKLMAAWFEDRHGAVPVDDLAVALADDSAWAAWVDDGAPEPGLSAVEPPLDDPYGLADLTAPTPPAVAAPSPVVIPLPVPPSAPEAPAAAPSLAPAPQHLAIATSPAVTPVLWHTMQRLKGRGALQAAFMAALTAPGFAPDVTPVPERLSQAAMRGDLLAGLYVQWLAPGSALEPPPHAWAWRVCRLWQHGATEAAPWQALLLEFPEHKAATLALQSLVSADEETARRVHRLRERLAQEPAAALSAEQSCALQMMAKAPGVAVDPGEVLALLQCAAVAAPEFETSAALPLAA